MHRRLPKKLRGLVVALVALVTGCATLPDVTPYRDATVQLRSAVVASGNALGTELANAARASDKQTKEKLERSAENFSEHWKARVEAADSLVAYAQALAEIAKAGKEGGDTARSLAAALGQVAVGVGIALPPAGAVATLTDTAAFVYAQIAAVRASRSLDEALVSAQPAVNEIASKLGKDLDASVVILQGAYQLQVLALADRYNREKGFLFSLERERQRLYDKAGLTREDEKRLKEIAELYDSTRSWREPMESAFTQLEKRFQAEREVVVATKAAVSEWAAAHRGLAAAVRDGRAINVEGLIQATLEARELVRRLKAL